MRRRALRSIGAPVRFAETTTAECACGDRGIFRNVAGGERMCIACAFERFTVAGPCCLCQMSPAAEGLTVSFDDVFFIGAACAACIKAPTHAQLDALERRAMAGHSSRVGTTAPGGAC